MIELLNLQSLILGQSKIWKCFVQVGNKNKEKLWPLWGNWSNNEWPFTIFQSFDISVLVICGFFFVTSGLPSGRSPTLSVLQIPHLWNGNSKSSYLLELFWVIIYKVPSVPSSMSRSIHLGCCDRTPQAGWLVALEPGSVRSRPGQVQCLVWACFLFQRQPSPHPVLTR